jgi:hypothetical protein
MHLALSLTFLLFFIGTVLATIHSRFWPLLRGNPYLVYKLVLDLASVVFLPVRAWRCTAASNSVRPSSP